jgi:hypothetical protein
MLHESHIFSSHALSYVRATVFPFFNEALPTVMAYELNDRCYINVTLRHRCVQTDQWANNPSSYATNIGRSSSGDGAV